VLFSWYKNVEKHVVRGLRRSALRASLGTRFTRTQVTPRSSAHNAVVEDAQMFQMVIPTPQNSLRDYSVKSNESERENDKNVLKISYEKAVRKGDLYRNAIFVLKG
jgi:hypothetical protein